MATTFGIPMNDTSKKHEGYEDYMVRRLREEQANLQSDNIDLINHPPHYNQGGIECIDAIEAALGTEAFLAYCRGNIIKYMWRADHKNGAEDLEKAHWYADRIVQTLSKGQK